MKRFKTFAIVGLFVLISCLIASCGSGDEPPSKEPLLIKEVWRFGEAIFDDPLGSNETILLPLFGRAGLQLRISADGSYDFPFLEVSTQEIEYREGGSWELTQKETQIIFIDAQTATQERWDILLLTHSELSIKTDILEEGVKVNDMELRFTH